MDEFKMYKPLHGQTPGGSSGTYHQNQSPLMSFKSPPGGMGIGENMESSANNTANKNLQENNAKKASEAKDQPSFLDQLVDSANTVLKLQAAANVQ